MKKTFRNVLCIMLAVLLLAGSCVSLADAAKDYSGYRVYVCLGDSIPAGIGETNSTEKFLHRTPGAYPDIVANTIGAELIPLACAGSRTIELRACLEDDYVMPNEVTMTMDRAKVDEIRGAYVPAVAKADLITLNIGANDIATYALLLAAEAAKGLGINVLSVNSAVDMYEEEGDFTGAVASILDLAEKAGALVDVVNAIVGGLMEGYYHFSENWDAIIGDIFEINPDVTLMVVSLYNPFNHMKISDDSLLEIGKALDGVISLINAKMQYGSRYACKYIFVDVMGIESLFAKNGVSILDEGILEGAVLNVHPSMKGHAQIAEKVIAKIPEKSFELPFGDIAGLNDDYKQAIAWAYDKGVVNGKSANVFAPNAPCTRGEIVTMLWRAAGCPAPKSENCIFSDVNDTSYCAKAAQWAYESDITKGVGGGRFAPDAQCSRGEVVTFLYRSAGSPEVRSDVSFTDVAADSYCAEAAAWAVANGIAKGYGDGSFHPTAGCTRAQAVTFIFRFAA